MPDLDKARAVAYKLSQSLGVATPNDIVLEDIVMSRGALVVEGPLEGAEARLVRKGNKGIIRVKSGISNKGKGRFALAHELGHWELHKDQTQWQFCSEGDLHDYANSDMEIEANTFASEFLMPTVLFRPKCENAAPDLKLIKVLSEEFQVSLTATAVRFVEETKHACIVVLSEDGVVKWWKKSPKCNDAWIDKRHSVKEGSAAWDCLQDGRTEPEEMEAVNREVWFSDSWVEDLYEQSIKLGQYPTILTLLWIP